MGALLADAGCDRGRLGAVDAESLGDRRQHERRVAKRCERHKKRAALCVLREQTRELQREAGLAGAAGAENGEDRRVVMEDERDGVEELLLASEEPGRRRRQAHRARAAERGKSLRAELEQPHRAVEVLQPVAAEVGQRRLGVEERGGRFGEQHLAAVGKRRDSRAAVDVDAHVALRGHRRRACVDAHADAYRPGLQRRLRLTRGGRRALRGRKRDEERVALRVDLDAAVCGERLAQKAPVLRERLGVRVWSERVQQPRRALDVREQERDRAGRKLGPHERHIEPSPLYGWV